MDTTRVFLKQIEDLVQIGTKSLPRRVFASGDRDNSFTVAGDIPPYVRVTMKIVPRYQSGWEGVGIYAFANTIDPEEAARQILESIRVSLVSDPLNVKR